MTAKEAKAAAEKIYPEAEIHCTRFVEETEFRATNRYEVKIAFKENTTSCYHNEPLSIHLQSRDSFEDIFTRIRKSVCDKQAQIVDEMRERVEQETKIAHAKLKDSILTLEATLKRYKAIQAEKEREEDALHNSKRES